MNPLATALCLCVAASATAQSPKFRFLHQMLPMEQNAAAAVQFGDVDGDGDADAFVANRGGRSALYRNDGGGRFVDVTPTSLPPGGERLTDCALVDVDMDGDLDAYLAAGSPSTESDLLFINDGHGVFSDQTATRLPADTRWTSVLGFGDLDGDGDPDAVLGGYEHFGPSPTRILRNEAGVFTEQAVLPLWEHAGVHALALADFDADGDLDLLVTGSPVTTNSLWLNDGRGVFSRAAETSVPEGVTGAVTLSVGDVDRDDDLDVLVGRGAPNTGSLLWLNDGAGSFRDVSESQLPVATGQTVATLLVDVDGDSDLDAVLGNMHNIDPGQNVLWLNNGKGRFSEGALPRLLDNTFGIAAADVDGDQDQDLYIANAGLWHAQDRLLLNDGDGGFVDVTTPKLPADWGVDMDLEVGDLDGDGFDDLFLAGARAGSSEVDSGVEQNLPRVYLNDGCGGFRDVTTLSLELGIATGSGVALGDVDGDGDLDALVGTGGTSHEQADRLFLNDGSGRFEVAAEGQFPGKEPLFRDSVALGDLDGDGDLDACVAGIEYLNDGEGWFSLMPDAIPADKGVALDLELGDVDGDGDLDIVGAGDHDFRGRPIVRLYLNDGDGGFGQVQPLLWPGVPARSANDIELFDKDGDGDLDLFAAISGGTPATSGNVLFENDGEGGFVDVSAAALPADMPDHVAVSVADFDGDGDLDLLLVDQVLRLHLNNGQGVFSESILDLGMVSDYPFDDSVRALGCADFDHDGDVDVFLANSTDRNRVLTNMRSQLAWRSLPRIGQDLVLDVSGSPNSIWFVGFAFTPAEYWTPFGQLRLDPRHLGFVGLGWLDAEGEAVHRLSIPDRPALLGRDLFLQGLVGRPLRFTNLEKATLSGLSSSRTKPGKGQGKPQGPH